MIKISRLGLIHGAFVLFAVTLVGRAAYVQLGQTARWRQAAQQQQLVDRELPAMRGAILDAAGTVLVDSRELVRLAIAPPEVRDRAVLADALRQVAVPEEFVRRATDPARKWVELPGRYLSTDVTALLAMRGVHATSVIERVPPATAGLRSLLGTVNRDGEAVGGVEASLDAVLRGRPGRSVLVRAGRVGPLSSPEERFDPPVPGHSVTLTLHQGLQDIAERALADAIGSMRARGGDIVVLDPHSGAIRALASRRADPTASGATALTEPYEPGSTLKPFVAAALLELRRVTVDETIPTFNGKFTLNGRTIADVHAAPRMTFAEVIQYSSNVGIVQFAQRLTPREQYAVLRDAGFGMVTGIPYPTESSGRLRPPAEWSLQSPASLAMGYEVAVTPLQLALAYGAIANGGELLEPALVQEVRTAAGRVTYRAGRRVVRRLMSPATARTMRGLLRDVVTGGTATAADLAVYALGGKSGTARRTRDDGRGYETGAYTASFVGLFPADDPQLVILVKLDDPKAGYGGLTAAPVTKAVLTAAIAARDAALDPSTLAGPPVRPVTAAAGTAVASGTGPDSSGRGGRAVTSDGASAASGAAVEGAPVRLEEPPLRGPVAFDLGVDRRPTVDSLPPRAVPDVTGLTTRAAVRALHRAGFRVVLTGAAAGAVTLPAAGTVLPAGATVRLSSLR
ncbi:MAG: hypothetical protein RL139_64 [Gemmatimonadota bacterium]